MEADTGRSCFYDSRGAVVPMVGDLSPENPLGGPMPRESIACGLTGLPDRDEVIRAQMSMKEDFYTEPQRFRIFIGTWNVNGQSPRLINDRFVDLSPWLACDPYPPDIYAIGFQELDLSKEAFLFNDSPREEEWRTAVELGLHKGGTYTRIKLVRLIGMMLVVYIKKNLRQYVQDVFAEAVGTGVLGRMVSRA